MGCLCKNLKMASLRIFNPLISKHIKNLFNTPGFIKWLFKCSKINKLGNFDFFILRFWPRPPLTYTTGSPSRKSDDKEKKKIKTRKAISKLFALNANAKAIAKLFALNANAIKSIHPRMHLHDLLWVSQKTYTQAMHSSCNLCR